MAEKYTSAYTGEQIDEGITKAQHIGAVEDAGFFYTDAVGYVGMKYTPSEGFDVVKVSDHFLTLIGGGGGGESGYTPLSDTEYNVPNS